MADEAARTEIVKTSEPSLRYAWYVVMVLTATYTLSFVDRQIISLLVGPIKDDMGISDFEISLLQGMAFALFYTILGIPLGRLADRKSRKIIIATGVAIWSFMTVVCGLARNYTQLFLARMGVGVGEAALSPAAYSMISDYFPRHKLATALSVYFMGVYVGSGLAFIFGGLVIDWVAGAGQVILPLVGEIAAWQLTFIIVGLPGILFVLLVWSIKEPKRRGRLKEEGSVIPLSDSFAFLWQRKSLYLPIFIALGFHTLFGYASASWMPEFYIRLFDMTRSDVAYIYGFIVLVGSGGGVIMAGMLSDKLEARGVRHAKLAIIIGAMTIMFPFAFIQPHITSVEGSFAMLAVTALMTGMPYGITAAILQLVTPNEMRGFVTATYLFTINIIGLGFGPSITAAFTDFLFQDPMLLNWSLSLTALVSIPAAAIILIFALKPYNRALREAESWNA